MRTSLRPADLSSYLQAQISTQFPDRGRVRMRKIVDRALERIELSFGQIILRGYRDAQGATFSHLQGDQYAAFLYFASHSAWIDREDSTLASKLFLLNKSQSGLVCMYDTVLPDVFVLMHTVGTVLGKASYANYFVAAQNVTVGMDRGETPQFGERTVLYGGSMVVGSSVLGASVTIGAGSIVRGAEIPAGSVVGGSSPDLVIKPAARDVASLYFDAPTS